ncbi:LOW QUALITY PROTEIN: hypothetical protein BC938DRAFT_478106 [Jimgerdemannia flammicorona]|uniref:Scaffold protein Nfu/NifU N-terminal domain-containing protein n=1 Tax=Jimgerdemannia flammicorona TaxID=994334 RepID=A0A433QNC3_9FUNG|nr:LOW QUALITY PROTEIN: hypothetical protein BC938DRAFT_478106 [Jimgerdemannia flammicorona]
MPCCRSDPHHHDECSPITSRVISETDRLATSCAQHGHPNQTTPNADFLEFVSGVPVMKQGTAEFLDFRSTMTSPLAEALFQIDGVRRIFYGPGLYRNLQGRRRYLYYYGLLCVRPGHSPRWRAGALRHRDPPGRPGGRPDDQQEDGDDIEYRGFVNDVVKLKLKESCRGCDSSVVTLKNGIPSVEQGMGEDEIVAQKEFEKLEKLSERNICKSVHGDLFQNILSAVIVANGAEKYADTCAPKAWTFVLAHTLSCKSHNCLNNQGFGVRRLDR